MQYEKLNGYDASSIAASWLLRGIQPIPVSPKSKIPKGGKGWNKQILTEEDLPKAFDAHDNVGGLWGSPSQWVVDIDLDWDEAALIAPSILPETFIYGRPSRPGTHYLYKAQGMQGYKCRSSDGIIVEVRSTGSQSVLPPSWHPDTEQYQIENDVDITETQPKLLHKKIHLVAAGALLARKYPKEGGRHDYVHALTGALVRGGWEDKRIIQFVKSVVSASGKENDVRQRIITIDNTLLHTRKGDHTYGWTTLQAWFDKHTITLLKQWLGMYKTLEMSSNPLKISRRIKPENFIDKTSSLLEVGGMVKTISDWASKRGHVIQPLFNLSVGLMSVAFLTQNKYVVDSWDTPLQPYFMLSSRTGGGKENAIDSVYYLMRQLNLHEAAFSGFQSYHSMLDKLAVPPNAAIWLWDEAARRLKAATRSVTGPDHQVMTWVTSLFGKANSCVPGSTARKMVIPPIDRPFLTIMAAAQPIQLVEALSGDEIDTGFVNRFILFDVGDKPPVSNNARSNLFPSKILDFYEKIQHARHAHDEEFIKIGFENSTAYNIFTSFDEEARVYAHEDNAATMWGRANQQALILAGIMAVGMNPNRPIITEDVGYWATKFMRWAIACWIYRIHTASSSSIVEKRSKRVERAIRGAGKLPKLKSYGKKNSAILKNNLMPRSILTGMFRDMRPSELDDVLLQLQQAEIINVGETQGSEVYYCRR